MANCSKCGAPIPEGTFRKRCATCREQNRRACAIWNEKALCGCFCHRDYGAKVCVECAHEHPTLVPELKPKNTDSVVASAEWVPAKDFQPAGVEVGSEKWWTLRTKYEEEFKRIQKSLQKSVSFSG